MEMPDIPIELWDLISTILVVDSSDTKSGYISAHIDPEPYWILVRTATKFGKRSISDMESVFIRRLTIRGKICTVLPNSSYHSINNEPKFKHEPSIRYPDGRQKWHKHGKKHRDGKPAVTYTFGAEEWYQHGLWHRDDGPSAELLPAIIDNRNTKIWIQSGVIHRDDGPAVYTNSVQKYYSHGLLHREGVPQLPAVIDSSGVEKWWRRGRLHREGAPAVTYSDGSSEWWNDGKRYDAALFGFAGDDEPLTMASINNDEINGYTKIVADCDHDHGDEQLKSNGICVWYCDAECSCHGMITHSDSKTSIFLGGKYVVISPSNRHKS